jgi:hypothetical protein
MIRTVHGATSLHLTWRTGPFAWLVALSLGASPVAMAETQDDTSRARPPKFQLQEASVTDIHEAIR